MKIPLVGNFVQSKFVSFPFSMTPAAGEKVLADSERGEFQLDWENYKKKEKERERGKNNLDENLIKIWVFLAKKHLLKCQTKHKLLDLWYQALNDESYQVRKLLLKELLPFLDLAYQM